MRLTDLIPLPSNINPGLSPARQTTMLALLGSPRDNLTADCQQPTNRTLINLLAAGDLGIFRVYGLKHAVADLERIFRDIESEQREVFDSLGYSGMLCTRLVRGSTSSISNHAWGTAIDLNLDGRLDVVGDHQVQQGLALIAPIFNRHGWYWGAGFGREDAMHFEVSDERMRQWHAEGVLTGRAPHLPDDSLSQGDRGAEVLALQKRLQALGFSLEADGSFGPITRAALVSFQTSQALPPSGSLDADTAAALAEAVAPEETDDRTPILLLGTQGAAVSQWQEFLVQQALLQPGSVDGEFGPVTRSATIAFQTQHRLVPDGVVGPKTRAEAEALGLGRAAPPEVRTGTLRRMRNDELTADIIQQAPRLLREHFSQPIGTQVPFMSGGRPLVGVLEWHFNERRGKHKGFSVFVPIT